MYIEKPKKIEEKNAMTNPLIRLWTSPGSRVSFIPLNTTQRLPLSNVVELQKQLLNIPVTWKKQTKRMPIADAIATHFPNHRHTTAPALR